MRYLTLWLILGLGLDAHANQALNRYQGTYKLDHALCKQEGTMHFQEYEQTVIFTENRSTLISESGNCRRTITNLEVLRQPDGSILLSRGEEVCSQQDCSMNFTMSGQNSNKSIQTSCPAPSNVHLEYKYVHTGHHLIAVNREEFECRLIYKPTPNEAKENVVAEKKFDKGQ